LSDAQLEFAKKYLVRSFPFLAETPEKLLDQRIYDRIVGRPDNFLETYVSKIEAVTPKEAREAAKRHLNSQNLKIVILCTAKDFREKIGKELSTKTVDIVPYDKI